MAAGMQPLRYLPAVDDLSPAQMINLSQRKYDREVKRVEHEWQQRLSNYEKEVTGGLKPRKPKLRHAIICGASGWIVIARDPSTNQTVIEMLGVPEPGRPASVHMAAGHERFRGRRRRPERLKWDVTGLVGLGAGTGGVFGVATFHQLEVVWPAVAAAAGAGAALFGGGGFYYARRAINGRGESRELTAESPLAGDVERALFRAAQVRQGRDDHAKEVERTTAAGYAVLPVKADFGEPMDSAMHDAAWMLADPALPPEQRQNLLASVDRWASLLDQHIAGLWHRWSQFKASPAPPAQPAEAAVVDLVKQQQIKDKMAQLQSFQQELEDGIRAAETAINDVPVIDDGAADNR